MSKFAWLAQLLGLIVYTAASWWITATAGYAAFLAWITAFILVGAVWFALAMKLKARHEERPLPPVLVPLAYAFVGVGVLYDVVVLNWIVKPVLFLDYAREFTLTSYLQRILRNRRQRTWLDRYRVRLARAVCKMLDRYDPGHCRS